jgi:hypothetical protein
MVSPRKDPPSLTAAHSLKIETLFFFRVLPDSGLKRLKKLSLISALQIWLERELSNSEKDHQGTKNTISTMTIGCK